MMEMALSPNLWSQAPASPGNTILTALEMQLWREVQQRTILMVS